MQSIALNNCRLESLLEIMKALGQPAFRGKQLYQWMHQKLVFDFDEMTNLPKEFRRTLKDQFYLSSLTAVEILTSQTDGTQKFLFQLDDKNVIESVLMRYKHGNSICISSQVGCRMGCRFCASTLGGLERNLTAAEMLSQIYSIQNITGERISHVVVMGSGEPLDNYDNLLQFIEMLTDADGLNISQRNITVSTCGLVPEIKRLAERRLQITLAISLHAPNDQMRESLMPIAGKYRLPELLAACSDYFKQTGRRLTFEYSLVRGLNDNRQEAAELAKLIKNQHAHVNLIPVNPIKERDFRQSERKAIDAFRTVLEGHGIQTTIRREMGRDINGACGQLRKHYLENQEE